MDVAAILTYRCDSKCSMCYIWQNPTMPAEEVTVETLAKLPNGIDYLNLTGGEPTLRTDLYDIVRVVRPKAMQVEISTNGLHADRLERIVRDFPDVKIRFSLDGLGGTNDSIRGEKNGFSRKLAGMIRLKELGGKDLGFGVTIQDDNASQLAELFELATAHGVELATSTLHNGFQFHKSDNIPYDRLRIARQIEALIERQLNTWDVKTWFRAYLTLGLIRKVLGHPRLLPCTAATDFVFVDPWSDVFACNVRPDLKMGNLARQSWQEVFQGDRAKDIRQEVAGCTQNCWMVGSAKTAMRQRRLPKLPKTEPMLWVLANKLRVLFGRRIPFGKYINYQDVHTDTIPIVRKSFLETNVKRRLQMAADAHYSGRGNYYNR